MTATNMCSNFGGKWDSPPLKKGEKRYIYGRLRRLVLDSSIIKKMATESKTKGKKLDPHVTCIVNSCQRKIVQEFYSDGTTQFINMLWHWM